MPSTLCAHLTRDLFAIAKFLFFPRFQHRDSISVSNLHCILLLHITHSSKVNCTLDKVNCTLCVRKKHNFRPCHFTPWQERAFSFNAGRCSRSPLNKCSPCDHVKTNKHMLEFFSPSGSHSTPFQCIEAIQTRSIAWPFCDSRASCLHVWEPMKCGRPCSAERVEHAFIRL